MHVVAPSMEQKFFILYLKSQQTIVAREVDGEYFAANIDALDPDGFEAKLKIAEDSVAVIEPISMQRFHHMRDMAIARVRTQHIQTIANLQAVVDQGRKLGIVTDGDKPIDRKEDVVVPPPAIAPPKLTAVPKEEDAPLLEPAEAPIMSIAPSKTSGDKQEYDGAVVEVPTPGMK